MALELGEGVRIDFTDPAVLEIYRGLCAEIDRQRKRGRANQGDILTALCMYLSEMAATAPYHKAGTFSSDVLQMINLTLEAGLAQCEKKLAAKGQVQVTDGQAREPLATKGGKP